MKNKRLFALAAGLLCLAIVSVALVWSLSRDASEGNEPDPSTVETNPPTVENDPPTEEEPSREEPPTEEKPPVENNNTSERAKIEAILNDPFMLLVNREHKVSSDYVGSNLVEYSGENHYRLNATCAAALKELIDAGKGAGYNYILYSGYRSYSSQYNKYYNKIAAYQNEGKSEAEAIRLTNQYYAPPGGSEHHTGLAADVCIPSIVNQYGALHENYENTAEFRWFSQHAHEYGFILRYPKGDEDITGYNYEPWHYRYVGKEIAADIYRQGVTLEEYVEALEQRLKALK